MVRRAHTELGLNITVTEVLAMDFDEYLNLDAYVNKLIEDKEKN